MIHTLLILLAYIAGLITSKVFNSNKTASKSEMNIVDVGDNDSKEIVVINDDKSNIEKLITIHNETLLEDMSKIRLKSQSNEIKKGISIDNLIEYDEAIFV